MPEPKISCPLGSCCEEIKDNTLTRCAWYTKLIGKDPQSNKDIDEWRCSMAWIPLLLVEVASTSRANGDAAISTRDEITKRQDFFNSIVVHQIKKSKNLKHSHTPIVEGVEELHTQGISN
jgi:hypothetical protein